MASIVHQSNDRKTIDFKSFDGHRRRIRLGIATEEQALVFGKNVEALLAEQRLGAKPGPAVGRWIHGLSAKMRAKLEKFGLLRPTASKGLSKLDEFLGEHLKTLAVKESTLTMYGHTRRCLVAHFGKHKPLKDIMPVDGDRWRIALKAEGLSESTVNRRVGIARQMFRRAIKWKLITENPFADVKMGTQTNKARMFFVSPEMIRQVINVCADNQWKLLLALSRFGGLRCPSEHLLLKWTDVDWERGRVCVHSPKTEHHAGGDMRFVPLFPELRAHLQAVYDEAEDRQGYVITRYRQANTNLRSQFIRYIKKAGLTPWPKLFHNLRSSRQTELSEKYPVHVVCTWMGNSRAVAQEHYLQVTDAHFLQACEPGEPATAVGPSPPAQGVSMPVDAAKGLELLVAVWPRLPSEIQQHVLGMVQAVSMLKRAA